MDAFEMVVAVSTVLALVATVTLEFADVRFDLRRLSRPQTRRIASVQLIQLQKSEQKSEPLPLRKAA